MEIVFALVRAHQHGINHSQSGCDEKKGKWGNIIYHILLWGGGGGGGGELGNSKNFLLSIRLGLGGGGGKGGRTEVPLCSLSPLIAVDNLKTKDRLPPSE